MTLRGLLADPGIVGAWSLVPERSSIRFANRTLWGLMKVNGRFRTLEGSGHVDAGGSVSGRLVIGAASLRTGIGSRDRHLRSPDFFDVNRFPHIVVEVGAATPSGEHSAALISTLEVRGVIRPLTLTATITRLGIDTIHIVSRTTVDRTGWGVSGNMAGMMPTATALVADTIFVKV
ncbi:MAG TPA: YceI family protein [Mycobacterium sp.]|nr:YceI family protein [Mycobacterium sp.]